MECPSCKTELHIKRSYTEAKEGEVYTVQEYHCVNERCPLKSEVPVKIAEHRHESNRPDYHFYLCSECKIPLLKISDGEYIPISAATEKDGEISMTCPNCETRNTTRIKP